MASLLVDGEMKAADQANLDVAPRLRAAAHVLESVDERLEAGDRIITSLVVQVPLSPGKVVTADMGVLGRVTLSV
jgi:2-keto-4-pentenoate hydratase